MVRTQHIEVARSDSKRGEDGSDLDAFGILLPREPVFVEESAQRRDGDDRVAVRDHERTRPFDHHTIANPYEEKAVTIHVYGGEMTWADCFLPEGDHYVKTRRELCYTD